MGLKLMQEEVANLVNGTDASGSRSANGMNSSNDSSGAGETAPVIELSNQILGSAEIAGKSKRNVVGLI